MDFLEFKKKYPIQLNNQQEKAVLSTNGAILLLAVPGSGKTTVIVTRTAYLIKVKQVAPQHILTLTYSVAASKDMQQRYEFLFGREDNLTFKTIHSFCVCVLKEYEKQKQATLFTMLPNQSQVIAKIYYFLAKEYPNKTIIQEIINKLGYAKNRMLTKEQMQKIQIGNISLLAIEQAYDSYKKQHRQMDFDDQLQYAYQILKQNEDIRKKFKNQYLYIQIDEAQDTSFLQHQIISLLIQDNIFMVGDEDQSIYQFRAAYPQALLHFSDTYPKAQILVMEKNYRSTNHILAMANQFIKQNENRVDKTIQSNYSKGKPVKHIKCKNIEQQYNYLVAEAKKVEGTLAILYRNNSSCIPVVEILQEKKIPFRIREQDTDFFCDSMMQDMKDFLLFSDKMQQKEIFEKIYYKLNAGISKEMINTLDNIPKGETIFDVLLQQTLPNWQYSKIINLKRNFRLLRNQNAFKAIQMMVKELGYQEYLNSKIFDEMSKKAYEQKINILLGIAKKNKNVNNFLKKLSFLEKQIQQGSYPKKANIILSTIHATKGLEYDKVILIDMLEGVLPCVKRPEKIDTIKLQEQKELYEEEVRLFYVGMTRAKKELEIVSYEKDYQKEVADSEFISLLFTDES